MVGDCQRIVALLRLGMGKLVTRKASSGGRAAKKMRLAADLADVAPYWAARAVCRPEGKLLAASPPQQSPPQQSPAQQAAKQAQWVASATALAQEGYLGCKAWLHATERGALCTLCGRSKTARSTQPTWVTTPCLQTSKSAKTAIRKHAQSVTHQRAVEGAAALASNGPISRQLHTGEANTITEGVLKRLKVAHFCVEKRLPLTMCAGLRERLRSRRSARPLRDWRAAPACCTVLCCTIVYIVRCAHIYTLCCVLHGSQCGLHCTTQHRLCTQYVCSILYAHVPCAIHTVLHCYYTHTTAATTPHTVLHCAILHYSVYSALCTHTYTVLYAA